LLIQALEQKLALRAQAGLTRTRKIVASKVAPQVLRGGREVLQFASNDYLGLASDSRIAAAAAGAIAHWGVGAGASHLISGHTEIVEALEREIADFVGGAHTAGLTFSSGYLANLAVITALCDRNAAVFSDELNHACIIDGARLSGAEKHIFPHANYEVLAQQLKSSNAETKLIATDGVFSMDGDIAPLPQLLALAEQHDAWLLVDDAHAFGVIGEGRGTAAHFHAKSDRLIMMGTLGKAAGVAGAFVCAHPSVITWLVNTARSYIFTTAAPPLLAAAARESVRILRDDPSPRVNLFARIAQFRAGCAGLPWPLLPSKTAIQPLIVGENDAVLALSAALESRGLWVPAIRPPTVSPGSARLRVSLSGAHTAPQVERLISALHDLAS
jgi:8-amino-7-oxononanoate synthase